MDLRSLLHDPYDGQPLALTVFDDCNGVFAEADRTSFYPYVDGVAVLRHGQVPQAWFERFAAQLAPMHLPLSWQAHQLMERDDAFSFSREWGRAADDGHRLVWGQTPAERLAQHLQDVAMALPDVAGKLHLDVGCGIGILCTELARANALVVGADFSRAVYHAAAEARKAGVGGRTLFIQADLHHLPFAPGTFDVVYSNGVLHHTPSTKAAFGAIAPMAKPGGVCYAWLYHRAGTLGFRAFLRITNAMRAIVRRLPLGLQGITIEALLVAKRAYAGLRGKTIDIADARVDLYDTLTPRYKHYHTETQLAAWLSEAGYADIAATHTGNIYGFGMMGKKVEKRKTNA